MRLIKHVVTLIVYEAPIESSNYGGFNMDDVTGIMTHRLWHQQDYDGACIEYSMSEDYHELVGEEAIRADLEKTKVASWEDIKRITEHAKSDEEDEDGEGDDEDEDEDEDEDGEEG